MTIEKVNDKSTILSLFKGWDETFIWSCLQDCMGTAYTDNLHNPTSAQIIIGSFCFFAGDVSQKLIRHKPEWYPAKFIIMVPQNNQWGKEIESIYKDKVSKRIRYATKKQQGVFDQDKLQNIVSQLPQQYEIRLIDKKLYEQILQLDWAKDLCVNYNSYDDYQKNGLGVIILKNDQIVAGASSYSYYNGGIEIEIDTIESQRRQGLASVCGAKLILECLKRHRYPSWDAHNLESLALAQKLGYQFDKEYPAYDIIGF